VIIYHSFTLVWDCGTILCHVVSYMDVSSLPVVLSVWFCMYSSFQIYLRKGNRLILNGYYFKTCCSNIWPPLNKVIMNLSGTSRTPEVSTSVTTQTKLMGRARCQPTKCDLHFHRSKLTYQTLNRAFMRRELPSSKNTSAWQFSCFYTFTKHLIKINKKMFIKQT
jgi:hypothetical protein